MKRSISYHEVLLKKLKDRKQAAAYLNAAADDEDAQIFFMALRDIVEAHSGILVDFDELSD